MGDDLFATNIKHHYMANNFLLIVSFRLQITFYVDAPTAEVGTGSNGSSSALMMRWRMRLESG